MMIVVTIDLRLDNLVAGEASENRIVPSKTERPRASHARNRMLLTTHPLALFALLQPNKETLLCKSGKTKTIPIRTTGKA